MKRLSLFHTLLSLMAKRTSSLTPTNQPTILPPRPSVDDHEAWSAYWTAQGQPWRTELEIDTKRQEALNECRTVVPDIEKGIYPFKGMKLSRADVEWLLATHENGRGPVDWSDVNQRERVGLDLRGADLRQIDLQRLPLTRLRGGSRWPLGTIEQHKEASLCLDEANLSYTHLEGANLGLAQLRGAQLREAQLEETILDWAWLEEANLEGAQIKGASLMGANLVGASLEGANLTNTFLAEADLSGAELFIADFTGAILDSAILEDAHLNEACLERVILAGVVLGNTEHVGPELADVRWDGTNLAVVDWSQVTILGDEYNAAQKKKDKGKKKDKKSRLDDYRQAVRANRQLAVALQAQGMNEEATRFAYRAQVLQRRVFWFQMLQPKAKLRQRGQALGAWLFSWFLFLLAGYGYRPGRSVFWYIATIIGFCTAYSIFGHIPPLPDALVFSLTSFHGRGFFPGLGNEASLHDPLVVLAAAEAVIGLFIEISFIATFTQRFFGK